MNVEVSDKTHDMLRELAEKFGTTVEYLWPLLVGHRKVEAAVWLIVGIVVPAISIGLLALLFWLTWDDDEREAHETRLIAFIAGLIFSFAAIVPALSEVKSYFYPEAAVVMELMK